MSCSPEVKHILVYGAEGLQKRFVTTWNIGKSLKILVLYTPHLPAVPYTKNAPAFTKLNFLQARKSREDFNFSVDKTPFQTERPLEVLIASEDVMRKIFAKMSLKGEGHIHYNELTSRYRQGIMTTALPEKDRLTLLISFLTGFSIRNTLTDEDFADFAQATVGYTGGGIRNISRAIDDLRHIRETRLFNDPKNPALSGKDLMDLIGNPPSTVTKNWEDVIPSKPFINRPIPEYVRSQSF